MDPTERSRDRSRPSAGSQPGLLAGADVGGARPEARDPGGLGEVPEHPEVGGARVAVVEDDRGVGEEAADDEVPHHPAGRREPEEPVVGLKIDVEVHLLQRLEDDPAVAVDDRLRQTRRAGAVEHPERVVGRHLLEGQRHADSALAHLPPRHRTPNALRRMGSGRGTRAPPCAPPSAAPRAAPSRHPCGRSPCRRSGSRRPREAPSARSGRSGRSRSGRRSRASSSTRSRRSRRRRGTPRPPRGRSGDTRRPCHRARRQGHAGHRR